jgi:hypothetical protein
MYAESRKSCRTVDVTGSVASWQYSANVLANSAPEELCLEKKLNCAASLKATTEGYWKRLTALLCRSPPSEGG